MFRTSISIVEKLYIKRILQPFPVL